MAFSRQDARYEPVPINLDDYSAADMMADLGIQRRAALPLAGRALIIPPPPPDINKRGPRLAKLAEKNSSVPDAWSALYDPALVEERNDGLGEGQMHRTGPNYRPIEPRQRSPPRSLRFQRSPTRSLRHSKSLFELGKLPGAFSYSKGSPDLNITVKGANDRRKNRSPHELDGPPGDILAPLRLESVLRNPKIRAPRAPRGPEAIVRHHLAGNPPVIMRAASVASHISSRIVPDNPDVSHWNLGKLATSKGGYDYFKSISKRFITNPTPILGQGREANKFNYAAPVSGTLIVPSPSPIAIVPAKNHGLFKLNSHTPSIPSSPVPFTLVGQDVITAKLEGVANTIENETENREIYNKDKATEPLEPIRPINTPDTASQTTDLALKPHITVAIGTPFTFDLSDKSECFTSVVTPLTELSPEETKKYPLQPLTVPNPEYIENASNSTGSDSLEFYSPLASGNDFNEDMDLELLRKDFYSVRKIINELKARISGFDDFENSLKARVTEICRLRQEVINEIEIEERDMLNIKREIRAIGVKNINIVGGIRAKMERKEEVACVNVEPNEPPTRNPELNNSASFEAMSVRSLVVDAESTVRVKREKVKRDVPVWIHESDNIVPPRSPAIESQKVIRSELQIKDEEHSDTEITNTTPIIEDTGAEKAQKNHQTRRYQGMEEHLEAFDEESTENEQGKRNEFEILSETELPKNYQLGKELIPRETPPIERAENEDSKKDRLQNDESPKYEQLPELSGPVHAERTCYKKEKPENVEPLIKQETETTVFKEQKILNIEVDNITEDTRGNAAEKAHVMNGEDFNIQDKVLQKERAEKPPQETIEILEEQESMEDKSLGKEKDGKGKGHDGSEHLNPLHLGQRFIDQDEKDKQSVKTGQLKKKHSVKEYPEQKNLDRDSHNKTCEEARRLWVEEEKLVRDHLGLVKLQEKFRADEKARREVEQWGDLGLSEKNKLFRNATSQEELIEREREGVELEKVVENRSPEDIGLKKAMVEDVVSGNELPTVAAVKQQEYFIPPQPVLPLPLVATPKKAAFPYKIDLDLRPIFDYPPLRVKIQQFGRPQEAIVKDCKDILTPVEFEILDNMPYFQQFLSNCNERHSKKMARIYGNASSH